jgi:hypothetical protein
MFFERKSKMPTEYTRKFIEDVIIETEQKEILVTACYMFDLLVTKESITVEEIEPIVTAAKHKSMSVWQIGANFLWALAVKHEVAREFIRILITSKKANERFQIMASYREDVPTWFSKEIILIGIHDKKGRRVREKAAEAFYALDLKELIPIFEEAYVNETNEQTKKSIGLFLPLVRDGYKLEQIDEHTLSLTFRTKGLGMKGMWVRPEEVKTKEMIDNIIFENNRIRS